VAVFEYRGIVVASGKATKGIRDAENAKTLRASLRKEGILLTTATEEAEAKLKRKGNLNIKQWFNRPNTADIAMMTRQLATLVRARIPLFEALSALIDQVEKESLRRALTNVREQIREGTSFADALATHPTIFAEMYVNMVRAGEASGTLEAVLGRLANFVEDQSKLKSKVTGALAYPAMMMVISTGIISLLMVSVVPKMTKLFANMNQALPIYTRVLVASSNFLADFWWIISLLVALAVVVFRRWKKTAEGRLRWDHFLLHMPMFGSLLRMVSIARFSRTLATLLSAGVALLPAMGIVRNVLGNSALEAVVGDATARIREGESIADPLKASGLFPPLVTHMIAIGEKSGELEEMLVNVADAYDTAVENRVEVLTRLLEPIIILVMGGAVAFIAFAVLMPMLELRSV
jgi:general secretion pathway protein F